MNSSRLVLFLLSFFLVQGACAEPGVRILYPANGVILQPGPSEQGFFSCVLDVESFGAPVWRMGVEVDGIFMSVRHFHEKDAVLRAQLPWWPWRGNDRYVIRVYADEMPVSGNRRFTNEVSVRVQGIPPEVANPQNQIIAYYREHLGQRIFAPPITRFYHEGGAHNRWESAAYIGDTLYMVSLDDSGRISGGRVPISRPLRAGESGIPVQRPEGLYRVLIAFMDFGGTDITRDDALRAVPELSRVVNDWHKNFARERGLSKPILELHMTGCYARVDPRSELIFSADEIRTLTGINPADFNLLAQVDLSRENRSPESDSGGLSFYGNAGPQAERVTFWTSLSTKADMVNHLALVLFDHELAHCFGWIHEWSVGDGGYVDHVDRSSSIPALMFGWTDTDGDGVIEILDSTPYGLEN